VQRDEDKNVREQEEQKIENADLQEYEDTFKARLKGIEVEIKELEEFEGIL